MMFLSQSDLVALSGYKRRSLVARWLRDNGFVFVLGIDGWPRVAHSHIARRRRFTVSVRCYGRLRTSTGARCENRRRVDTALTLRDLFAAGHDHRQNTGAFDSRSHSERVV